MAKIVIYKTDINDPLKNSEEKLQTCIGTKRASK